MYDCILLLLYLLNYFWLSWDPDESASWYCDQHCFKIGSEVIESVWDAALTLKPSLGKLATSEAIGMAYRRMRHAKPGGLWHPLSVWNGLTRSNMRRSLINAEAIFKEHQRRKGTVHSAWKDCKFLLKHIDTIDFNSKRWLRWFGSQNGDSKSPYRPCKTKPKDLVSRKAWCKVHCVLDGKNIVDVDRNTFDMTEPPQCINEKLFPNCKVSGDTIQAYRNYYIAKTQTVGGGMRYYYTDPPRWLDGNDTSLSPPQYRLDSQGYVIVRFVE